MALARLRSLVLDTADTEASARFWSALLGWPEVRRDGAWIDLSDGVLTLGFQHAPDHVPPVWGDPAHPQQIHFDLPVGDIEAAERAVLELGGRLLACEEGADGPFRVYADPAGHPFCLEPSALASGPGSADALPGLVWHPAPVSVVATGTAVTVGVGPLTDLFADPGGGAPVVSATRSVVPVPAGRFQLTARVQVEFASAFDAGVLLLWGDERHWAKLCFEYSPDAEPMAVSVVTRGVSDDANGFVVDGNLAWLRVSRREDVYAFHASVDGAHWQLVRVFALPGVTSVGLLAQSPTGRGCVVRFDRISLTPTTWTDLRDGA